MSSIQYLIGKTLGKYEILEHIGHGGMSEVYKGQQSQLDRMVAIKVLHPFLADEEGFVVRFQREARIVATMRHPNIVQVYDFDYHDELALYYMVMEYIDGPTLKDLLEQEICTPEETARLGAAVADALDYAHQRSMIHRDIKPANIMFLDADQPVLTDFGIAKMLTLSGLTASGAMVGTPAYMAPEIGLGKTGTAASDIYSLSVVLYQAVTGALPFTAETPMGMVMQHINKTPLPPSAYAPALPTALEAVIMRGLEKAPEDRYATAGDMAHALRLAHRQAADPDAPISLVKAPVDREGVTEKMGGASLAPGPEEQSPVADFVAGAIPVDSAAGDGAGAEADGVLPATTRLLSDEAAPADSDREPQGVRRRPWLRLLALLPAVFVLIVVIAGGGLWSGMQTRFPTAIRQFLSARSVAAPQPTAVAPAAAEVAPAAAETVIAATPAPATAVPTPTPEPEATPEPVVDAPLTVTPAPCSQRVRVDGVQIRPDETTGPNGLLVAYISMRNSGTCTWPSNTSLDLIATEAISAPTTFAVSSLAPNETIQFVIPMTAPEALGTYAIVWELRTGDEPLGRGETGLVEFEIIVDDIPPPTLAQSEPIVVPEVTPAPLAVATPAMIAWELLPAQDLWRGTAAITVTGGTGTHRVYENRISAETEVVDGRLTFTWRRCQPYPVELWVLSGEEALNWTGVVPVPASAPCP